MSEQTGQDEGPLRVTIREAAHRLGVTEGAVRKRIQHGSLRGMTRPERVGQTLELATHPIPDELWSELNSLG
jgi:hypothetical protein